MKSKPVTHIKDLLHDPKNARKHTPRNVGTIVSALQEVGAARSIVIDEDGVVLAGNATMDAAAEAGITAVKVVEANGNELVAVRRIGLSAEQKTRLALYDNRAAELADWDTDVLRQLAMDNQLDGLFNADELAELVGDLAQAELMGDPDEVPEPPVNPITQPGDLWLLGDHRLLCGDASDPRVHERLMAGLSHQLTVVDPPYEMPDSVWAKWIDDPSIVFGQMRQMRMIPAKWWRFERVIVKRYRHRSATVQIDHRHAFVAQVGSQKVLPHTSETFPSVVEQEADTEHDHQKPVGLLLEHMVKWAPPWDVVLDPFMGSGSTLIAAEQLGRQCYGMEISPEYCDVIVKRWEQLTGKTATRETVQA